MKHLELSIRQTALKIFIKTKIISTGLILFCALLFSDNIYAQSNIPVKGYITSQSGEPLAGATILVKGRTNATTSGNDGRFEISVPENSTLLLSYIGFISKEIKVGNKALPNLSVQLITNKNELDQVIVVGYGTRKKSDVTG